MGNKAYQQKMLKTTHQYSKLLESENLIDTDSIVVEIGCGTGVLTKLIAETRPKEIIGFEIDKEFYHTLFSNVGEIFADTEMLYKFKLYGEFNIETFDDITKDVKDFSNHVLISNPPYDILPMVDEFIEKYNFKKVVLMIPQRLLPHYILLGYKSKFFLTGDDFEPPSTGYHHIVAKGF